MKWHREARSNVKVETGAEYWGYFSDARPDHSKPHGHNKISSSNLRTDSCVGADAERCGFETGSRFELKGYAMEPGVAWHSR
jgi:hypothetical protein